MSAEAAALPRSWQVGKYTATLTAPKARPGTVASACIEWTPHVPQRLTSAELEQYHAGRNRALAELAAALGINAAVVDL
jgi:hypothetical protein